MSPPARVIVLNGPSSAGKTTIAEAFRAHHAATGRYWLVMGIDDFLGKLPEEWHGIGGWVGGHAADGIRFVPTPDGVEIHLGPTMRRVLAAYRAMVAAAARSGVDVLVDEVLFDEECWEGWRTALAGLDVAWVSVQCASEIAEQREAARGDRFPGLARGLNRIVHRFPAYDLEIDTGALAPAAAAERLVAFADRTAMGGAAGDVASDQSRSRAS